MQMDTKMLKKGIKKILFSFIGLFHEFFRRKWISKRCQLKTLSLPDMHVFFGYYDKVPFDKTEKRVLAMHVPFIHKQNCSEAHVGYYTLNGKDEWSEIGTTTTWCWQLGARLQWLGNDNDTVIYNSFSDGKYISVIYNVECQNRLRTIGMPVFDVNSNGTEAITLDFSRLHRMRPGYGYMNIPDKTIGQNVPDNSGIWRINLSTGSTTLIVSIADVVKFEPIESMSHAEHYFNHLKYNPSGDRFLFYHCWTKNGRRFTRLITCNRDGSDMYALINTGHASHDTWINDDELLVYATHHDEMYFRKYKDRTNTYTIVGKDKLHEDGHPSFGRGSKKNILLIDTYPNNFPIQKINLFNVETNDLQTVGRFFSKKIYRGAEKCDLHPRWSPTGQSIVFDSVFSGDKRGMHILQLEVHA